MGTNHSYVSPLRYPGGKSKISNFMEDILLLNNLENCTLYELYAGGAGASLTLLLSGVCNKIVLNDLDYHIYAFWHCVLYYTTELVKLINESEVNIKNWLIQRDIYENIKEHSILEVGFSAFFLNRANRSGILYKAGPIGGQDQTGTYKIDVRYNKTDLVNRIVRIAQLKDNIEIHNTESIDFLQMIFAKDSGNKFIFLDPPYYKQGENLYLNFYKDADHVRLRDILYANKNTSWLLTYDNCERINELYHDFRKGHSVMSYTLQEKRKSKEVMIFSDNLYLPKQFRTVSKQLKFDLVGQEN